MDINDRIKQLIVNARNVTSDGNDQITLTDTQLSRTLADTYPERKRVDWYRRLCDYRLGRTIPFATDLLKIVFISSPDVTSESVVWIIQTLVRNAIASSGSRRAFAEVLANRYPELSKEKYNARLHRYETGHSVPSSRIFLQILEIGSRRGMTGKHSIFIKKLLKGGE